MGIFGLGWRRQGRAGVDGDAMLAELRAIREQIEHLGERLGQAATREELKNYVTADVFKHHLESHAKASENWRVWLPWAVTIVLGLFEILSGHAAKLLGGG
jgi:hypothetical protein